MWFLMAAYWQYWIKFWTYWMKSFGTKFDQNPFGQNPEEYALEIQKIWNGNGTFDQRSDATSKFIISVLNQIPAQQNLKEDTRNFLFMVAEQMEAIVRCTSTCNVAYV